MLTAKARLGCTNHARREPRRRAGAASADAQHQAVARCGQRASRSRWSKDDAAQVPLQRRARRSGAVSVGARLSRRAGGSPRRAGRSFRSCGSAGPNVTAIELSDRSTPAELDLVRAMAPRLRRDRRRRVRPRRVGQRPAGSRAAACAAAQRRSARQRDADAARRGVFFRQSLRRRIGAMCRRCC